MADAFTEGQEKFELEFGEQIKRLGVLQDEIAPIRVLQRRLDLQRRAVELYKTRLDAVEDRISRQKEMEIDWRQKDSRMLHLRCNGVPSIFRGADDVCVVDMLRIILGVLSVLAILWVLATPTQGYYLGSGDTDENPPEQRLGEYGGLPKEIVSLEADRLLRGRHP